MSWMQWLAKRFSFKKPAAGKQGGASKRRVHLVIEALELRDVPSATLVADKTDYAPGSTAHLSASGFLPGETVQFQVVHIDGRSNAGAGHAPFSVTDGSTGDLDGKKNGSIQTNWYVNPVDSIGATFEAIAKGLTSGLTAETKFTDAAVTEGASFSATSLNTVLNSTTGLQISLIGTDEDNDFAGDDTTYHFNVTSGPSHGTLNVSNLSNFTGTITNDGTANAQMTSVVTYKPTTGYIGTDSFTFHTEGDTTQSPDVTVNITVDPAIGVNSGSPQQAFITTAFGSTLQALVLDGNHNPISGASVVFNAPSTGASITFASGPGVVSNGGRTYTVNTNGSGIATSSVMTANGTVGAHYNVVATSSGIPGSASFDLTNTTLTVTPVNPVPTSAVINTPFNPNLKVVVKDGSGANQANVSITFTVHPVSGAGASFTSGQTYTVATLADGTATATALTANGTVGSFTVTAALTGGGASVTFSLTNSAGKLKFSQQPPASIYGGDSFVVKLQLTDASGNNVASAGRTVQLLLANDTVLGNGITDANGVATFTVTLKLPQTYTLMADLTDAVSPAIFSNPFAVKNRYRFGL